ncbi:MAG: hypothetical protein ABUL50_03865, partial [Rhizobacter sp.]
MNYIKAGVIGHEGGLGAQLRYAHGNFVLPLLEYQNVLRSWIGKTVIFGIRPEQITDSATAQRSEHRFFRRSCSIELVEPAG